MKSSIQRQSSGDTSASAENKSSKGLSMPAVPVLQQQKNDIANENIKTPVGQLKKEGHDKPFGLPLITGQNDNQPQKTLKQTQPFQLKKEIAQKADISGKDVAQLKRVWYGSATQKAQEGKTHHAKTIHYLTKHGSGVTDAFQRDRLLGQERAFIIVRDALVQEATLSIPDLDTAITELTASMARMGPAHKKYAATENRLNIATAKRDTARARIIALNAIVAGTPEMFAEMNGPKRAAYRDELKKPANFGAGTPTRVVTNFAENDTTMLSIAGQMVDSKRGELEAVVGEAAQPDPIKKGIITKEGPINADFKKHTLTGPGTVTHETVQNEAKNASFTFVAQEVPHVAPENVPEPVTLLVESGYIQP